MLKTRFKILDMINTDLKALDIDVMRFPIGKDEYGILVRGDSVLVVSPDNSPTSIFPVMKDDVVISINSKRNEIQITTLHGKK